MDLQSQTCVACKPGSPQVTPSELAQYRQQIPEWQVIQKDGENHLERTFIFGNFANALAFTDRVGQLAESQNHHPAILTEYGKVTVDWWTHAIGGLHMNDLVMASKTDSLYATAAGHK